MAKGLKLNLPSADDLFSTQEERDDAKREKVLDIPLSEIDSFPDHPFQVRMDESMQAMADSVKIFGIQTPAIVRQKEDGRYELVSGHRRKMAATLAALKTMPLIVRELSRDEAVIAMVDANLQRETILPSEKAMSYKMKQDAMKRQGQRTDLTSSPVARKLSGKETAEIIGETAGDSKDQVYRYIRLTELIPPLLQMVDEGKIAFRPAVELSYLQKPEQASLVDTMQCEDATPSLAQSIKMKQFSQERRLNEDVILSIMSEEKPNQKEKPALRDERITKLIPKNVPRGQESDFVVKALEHYNRHLQRQRGQER